MDKKNKNALDYEKLINQRLEDIESKLEELATKEELEYSIKELGFVIHEQKTHAKKSIDTGPNNKAKNNNSNLAPSWLEQSKINFYLAVLILSMIILAIGWFPTGNTFEAIQKAYVELIVNLPKMVILALGTYCAVKTVKRIKNKDM